MSTGNFFDDQKEQSAVKTNIVSKYFWAWAKVITSVQNRYSNSEKRIAYIDLFAGPGRYEDNTKSTPLLVLEQAIADPQMSDRLVTFFNDKNPKNAQSLKQAIQNLPNIGNLKHQPVVENAEIGSAIVEQFKHMQLVPTLLFVDPWGYKGLSLNLIDAVLKNWGCDCIFFFNYNRINMGLHNENVKEHMDALFGERRANELRTKLSPLTPHERELTIVEELGQAFQTMGYKFVLPFRFRNDEGTRTSHHLIFISKDFRGYDIMKGIMAGASSSSAQGVASFEYNPPDKTMPLLFELARPIDDLADMLLRDFSNKTISVEEIYKQHSVGKPYILRNYKEILKRLEGEGKVTANPPANSRKKDTMADTVIITFSK
ncbi:MAG: three-Cys-motif partner protein TcmP [Chloroflexi bacterium]|nr:three-Cys-motif partner protein TcmP [Chloroflexota bacterium]